MLPALKNIVFSDYVLRSELRCGGGFTKPPVGYSIFDARTDLWNSIPYYSHPKNAQVLLAIISAALFLVIQVIAQRFIFKVNLGLKVSGFIK